MRKAKLKNDTFWQRQTLPFIALWTAIYVATWFGAWGLITRINIYRYLPGQYGLNFIVAFITLLPALIQVQLIERMMGQSMRRWMLYSLFGSGISMGILTVLTSILREESVIPLALALMLPTTILQTIWLRRRVHSAWMWILASIVGSIIFSIPFRDTLGVTFAMVPAGLLYGLIQGSIMRHLLTQAKDTESAEVDLATDEHESQAESLERLQTLEHLRVIAPWAAADEQTEQRKTR